MLFFFFTERSSISDGLYQMNGFLCDVLLVDESDGSMIYYKELPRKYFLSRNEFSRAKHVFIIYLAYGFDK